MSPAARRSGGLLAAAVTSACVASCGEPVVEHVATLDVLEALEPDTVISAREFRTDGLLLLCGSDEKVEIRVSVESPPADGSCATLALERVDHEGAFPYADATIDGTVYPANEAHLLSRAGRWYVYLEGGRSQSVIQRHSGAVFAIQADAAADQPWLTLTCTRATEGFDEVGDTLYLCLRDLVPEQDVDLVAWTNRSTCSIDYSVCNQGATG